MILAAGIKSVLKRGNINNTVSIFKIIKDTIEYFKLNPHNCDFIHLGPYRYGYTHYFILLVMFKDEVFFVLDLYCGAGGASIGIHRALKNNNIEHLVIGIDNRGMPDYPKKLPFCFIKEDVFKIKRKLLKLSALIWASPPCQRFVACNLNKKTSHPDLIYKTRKLLKYSKRSYIIENVQKAPLRHDLMLCGTMFDLGVFRHRFFEIDGFICYPPKHFKHKGELGDGKYFCIHTAGPFPNLRNKKDPIYGTYESWSKAMDINWITFDWIDEKKRKSRETERGPILPSGHPLAEAIPPAFAQYIMHQFLKKWITLNKWIEI